MKVCLSCSSDLPDAGWSCPLCGWRAEQIGGILSFAPQLSGANDTYDPAWYEELVRLEAGNFWFVARNRLICALAKRYAPEQAKYLEIGCGTGFVLQMLRKAFPDWGIQAAETQFDGLAFAKSRLQSGALFLQMDACAIPFREEFDVIGAFDVLEHIQDDLAAIKQIYKALKNRGTLLLSVPQHRFLWSKYDETACHYRRYAAKDIERALAEAGFAILLSTSFNALPLPAMLLSRQLNNSRSDKSADVLAELKISPLINKILAIALAVEFQLFKFGIHFPFGGSRIIVAQKKA